MFTVNYPLLIDHIMREARLYLSMILRLQSRENINMEQEALDQELFWNRIMAMDSTIPIKKVTEDSLSATKAIRDYYSAAVGPYNTRSKSLFETFEYV